MKTRIEEKMERDNAGSHQITAQGDVTHASLLKRLQQVRVAVEEWIQRHLNKGKAQICSQNVSQPLRDTDRLITSFISHLSEAQKTLVEACNKLKEATHDHPRNTDPTPPFNHL